MLLKKVSHKEDFLDWLESNLDMDKESFNKVISIYKNIRDNKIVKIKIDLIVAEKLIDLLEKEVNKY